MKTYDELVKELREQQQTAGSAYSGAVWHLWDQFAPNWDPASDSSRDKLREFWSSVADWAGKLAVAASICEKKGVDDENR